MSAYVGQVQTAKLTRLIVGSHGCCQRALLICTLVAICVCNTTAGRNRSRGVRPSMTMETTSLIPRPELAALPTRSEGVTIAGSRAGRRSL